MKRPCAWMEDYAPHRKTHVAERDFLLRMAEDKVTTKILKKITKSGYYLDFTGFLGWFT